MYYLKAVGPHVGGFGIVVARELLAIRSRVPPVHRCGLQAAVDHISALWIRYQKSISRPGGPVSSQVASRTREKRQKPRKTYEYEAQHQVIQSYSAREESDAHI